MSRNEQAVIDAALKYRDTIYYDYSCFIFPPTWESYQDEELDHAQREFIKVIDEYQPYGRRPPLEEDAGTKTQKRDRNALSERQLEVLKLLCQGLSNPEIAEALTIELPTTKHHVINILNKLGVENRVQAAVKAVKEGLV